MASARNYQPLLKIDTLARRDRIEINGASYELKKRDEFSILDSSKFVQYGKRLDELRAKAEKDPGAVTDDEVGELSTITDAMIRLIVLAPSDVLDTLSDVHRLQILQARVPDAFRKLAPQTQAAKARAPRGKGRRRTGANSSRDSSGSIRARTR